MTREAMHTGVLSDTQPSTYADPEAPELSDAAGAAGPEAPEASANSVAKPSTHLHPNPAFTTPNVE